MQQPQDTTESKEECYQTQISIDSSRLQVIDTLARSLDVNREAIVSIAFLIGLGSLTHSDNSIGVYEKLNGLLK